MWAEPWEWVPAYSGGKWIYPMLTSVWVGKGGHVTPSPMSLVTLVCLGESCPTMCLQNLQTDLRGAAERIDALLVLGEGLAQRSEPQAWASLQHLLKALRAHRDTIFRQLWRLQAQLVSYSLVWPTLAGPVPGANFTTPMTSDFCFLTRYLKRPTHWTKIWRSRGTWIGQHLVGSGGLGHPVASPLLQNWSGTQQGMLGALSPCDKGQPGHQELPVSCVATGAPRAGDKALR